MYFYYTGTLIANGLVFGGKVKAHGKAQDIGENWRRGIPGNPLYCAHTVTRQPRHSAQYQLNLGRSESMVYSLN
jgi:hypothetical protein